MSRALIGMLAAALVLTAAPHALASGDQFVWAEHGLFIIDFVVLVFILWYFGRKPFRAFLERRHEAAKKEMEEAVALKEAAETRLDKYDTLLSNFEQEVADIRQKFKEDGERERERILADAVKASERLRAESELRMTQETAQLRHDLEIEVAERVVEVARQKLAAKMTPATQTALVKAYINQLESLKELQTTASI